MTQKEFTDLPELLTRAQVVLCGVPSGSVDYLRVGLTEAAPAAPHGKIGAVQVPGRGCKSAKNAKWKYRKTDVARIVGYKT